MRWLSVGEAVCDVKEIFGKPPRAFFSLANKITLLDTTSHPADGYFGGENFTSRPKRGNVLLLTESRPQSRPGSAARAG